MRRYRVPVSVLLLAAALLVTLTGCSAFATIRPIAPPEASGSGMLAQGSSFRTSKGFDPVAYANSIWSSKVLPTADKEAVPLPDLLAALSADKDAASTKYGHREVGGPYNFMAKVDGEVTDVNTTSRVGIITVKPAGYNGSSVVQVQVGPVIQGTSIRDGVGFIKFNDFLNQIEYADAADQLNQHVLNDVLKGKDPASLKGKAVSVAGVFTLDDPAKIVITPVRLDVKG
jgi:predicted lipoprotein